MHDGISFSVEHIFDQIAEADILEELCKFILAAQLHLAAFSNKVCLFSDVFNTRHIEFLLLASLFLIQLC